MTYYPIPLHRMRVFADRHVVVSPLENAERLCDKVLNLPMEPLMTAEEMEFVVKNLVEARY